MIKSRRHKIPKSGKSFSKSIGLQCKTEWEWCMACGIAAWWCAYDEWRDDGGQMMKGHMMSGNMMMGGTWWAGKEWVITIPNWPRSRWSNINTWWNQYTGMQTDDDESHDAASKTICGCSLQSKKVNWLNNSRLGGFVFCNLKTTPLSPLHKLKSARKLVILWKTFECSCWRRRAIRDDEWHFLRWEIRSLG